MVTGVEIAAFVLATLPLIVNQLSAYADGLESTKLLRGRTYARQMRMWSFQLSAQKVILENTVMRLLEDTGTFTTFDDDTPRGDRHEIRPLWSQAADDVLRERLRSAYQPYVGTMRGLVYSMEDMAKRLGLDLKSGEQTGWHSKNVLRDGFGKCKIVVSKTIYEDLFDKIDRANLILNQLTEQTLQQEETRRKRPYRKLPQRYRTVRNYARSLHRAMLHERRWKCRCKTQHLVNLRILPHHRHDEQDFLDTVTFAIKVALSFPGNARTSSAMWQVYEVEMESGPVFQADDFRGATPGWNGAHVSQLVPGSCFEEDQNPSGLPGCVHHSLMPTQPLTARPANTPPGSRQSKRVQFDFHSVGARATNKMVVGSKPSGAEIFSICPALAVCPREHRPCVGYLKDDQGSNQCHTMYLTGKSDRELKMYSLEGLLMQAGPPTLAAPTYTISWRHRLLLATTLASNVLQLHGSWFKPEWKIRDILFEHVGPPDTVAIETPYVSWIMSSTTASSHGNTLNARALSPLINSEVLFPLGLALVELALCKPLPLMRQDSDADRDPAVADLITAKRMLPAVVADFGVVYSDVVNRCLSWTGPQDSGIEDDKFQRAAFELIVQPLLDMMKSFEGR